MDLQKARQNALESENSLRALLLSKRLDIPHNIEHLIEDLSYWEAKDRAFTACYIRFLEHFHPPMSPPPDPNNKAFVPPKFLDSPSPKPSLAAVASNRSNHDVKEWIRTQQDLSDAKHERSLPPTPKLRKEIKSSRSRVLNLNNALERRDRQRSQPRATIGSAQRVAKPFKSRLQGPRTRSMRQTLLKEK